MPPAPTGAARRHEEHIASTTAVEHRGRLNPEGPRQWWGVPGRTLEAVLEHIEADNTPRLEYPAHPPSLAAAANEDGNLLVVGLPFLWIAGAPPR